MKRACLFVLQLLPLFGLLSCSGSYDRVFVDEKVEEKPFYIRNKKEAMERFSVILSNVTSKEKGILAFLKAEAKKKIDNGYNVFYPLVKQKMIRGIPFREILAKYAHDVKEIDEIEREVPLLNIHIPEIGDVKVENMKVEGNEIPILFGRNMYFDGNLVDSLGKFDVPGFHVLVVCENSGIRERNASTRSLSENMINDQYEYVDKSFNPKFEGLHSQTLRSYSEEYDKIHCKYDSDILYWEWLERDLVYTYLRAAKKNSRATRPLMYYNLKDIDENPTQLRSNIRDHIFRFKIAPEAFLSMKDIAEGNPENPKKMFENDVTNEIYSLSREEILDRILTGRAFCFLFQIEDEVMGQYVANQSIRIYATPEKIFNLRINKKRIHPTLFRHTKYIYTIDVKKIKSKWYYPKDHAHDTRLSRWDITKDPLNKRIVLYLINPDEGMDVSVTDTYSIEHLSAFETNSSSNVGVEVGDPKEVKVAINNGVNNKFSHSMISKHIVNSTYKVTLRNLRLAEFKMNYFDPPIISHEWVDDDVLGLSPTSFGNGPVSISILPISDEYYARGNTEE